jgi:acyl-CoA synthetase (AMP-forming)/AMP-acid ligase II
MDWEQRMAFGPADNLMDTAYPFIRSNPLQRSVVFVDALTISAAGKILKRELRELYGTRGNSLEQTQRIDNG